MNAFINIQNITKTFRQIFLHCEEGLIRNKSSADEKKGIIKKIRVKKIFILNLRVFIIYKCNYVHPSLELDAIIEFSVLSQTTHPFALYSSSNLSK